MDTHSRPLFVSSPVPQAWGSPPIPITIATSSPPDPSVLPVRTDKLARDKLENACLTQKLQEMKQQLRQMSVRQNQTVLSPPSAPDLPTIVAAVLAALQQHQTPTPPATPPTCPLQVPTASHLPSTPAPQLNMDVSFAASSINKEDD
ncbi:hypothetical protein ACA910_015882 [Epithemia clementina (nom. ined.)]